MSVRVALLKFIHKTHTCAHTLGKVSMYRSGHKPAKQLLKCIIKADVAYVRVIIAQNTVAEFRRDNCITIHCQCSLDSSLKKVLTPGNYYRNLDYCRSRERQISLQPFFWFVFGISFRHSYVFILVQYYFLLNKMWNFLKCLY